MAFATRLGVIKATLVRGFSSRNRLVRTRMLGGVGAAVSNGGGYPIYPPSPDSKALLRIEYVKRRLGVVLEYLEYERSK